MDKLFFDSLGSLVAIAISAPILYAMVIAFVRVSGKRSTSQMNNFDWIVTVAMGSLLATGIVSQDVSMADALLAMAILLGMQYLVTRAVMSDGIVRRLVKARPAVLMRDGEFIRETMREERMTEGEVLSAIRAQGVRSVDAVAAVILETDARMSVIPRKNDSETGPSDLGDNILP